MSKVILHKKSTRYLIKYMSDLDYLASKGIIPKINILGAELFSSSYVSEDKKFSFVPELIACTQKEFNISQEKDVDWFEHLALAKEFLEKKNIYLPSPDFSRYVLIHGDLNTNNIIFSQEKPVFIDLEHVKNGPLAYDLARPLLRFAKNCPEKYLEAYFDGDDALSKEELEEGKLFFYAIQAYERTRLHRFKDAKESIALLENYL